MRNVTVGMMIRRLLIFVFAALLLFQLVDWLPWRDGNRLMIADLKNDGRVTAYPVNRKLNMDDDTFTLKELYTTSKRTAIRYAFRKKVRDGWSFPTASVKLLDASGNELIQHGASSTGVPWGENGWIYFDPLPAGTKKLTLRYDWYDRQSELPILLEKEESTQ
ncbi:DUF5643 domain-containing protein [Paenibacillus sp. PSB04]|uniref:DUF5643 domain-containing protein n=2 Tax=unclassified Paenibacillus TaxID=185978 RepID=UPI00117DCA14|nr:DUF5643 domain-containing protein [Paenibacillus sp. PSB04]UYO07164.1 hypothetical protein K2F33_15685 [Paenibacillus sp. PSB04]